MLGEYGRGLLNKRCFFSLFDYVLMVFRIRLHFIAILNSMS